MLCHAYAVFPVSTNHSGTACRAFTASPNATRSSSSSQTSGMFLVLCPVDVEVAKTRQRAGLAEPFQAAGSLRADASHRDLQRRADLRVRTRRIADEHGH